MLKLAKSSNVEHSLESQCVCLRERERERERKREEDALISVKLSANLVPIVTVNTKQGCCY